VHHSSDIKAHELLQQFYNITGSDVNNMV